MNLHQEINLNINPDQTHQLIKFFFITASIVTLILSIFFSIKTLLSLTSPLPSTEGSQILNIIQINQAADLITQKTAKFTTR